MKKTIHNLLLVALLFIGATMKVNAQQILHPSFTITADTVCTGVYVYPTNTTTVDFPSSMSYLKYEWSTNYNGTTQYWSGPSLNQGVAFNWGSNTYFLTLTVTDTVNNIGYSFSQPIHVYDRPNWTLISPQSPAIDCVDSVIVTATNNDPNTTFIWKDNSNAIVGSGQQCTFHLGGNYSVTAVSTISGCVSNNTNYFNVQNNGQTEINIYATYSNINSWDIDVFGDTVEVCGSTATLRFNNSGPFYNNLTWDNGSHLYNRTITSSGIYWLTHVSPSGCSVTDTIYVIMHPNPVLPITATGPTIFCNGENVTLQTTPNLQNYNWQGALGQGNTAFVSWDGSVTVIATDSFGCVGQSQQITITVLITPTQPMISQVGCHTFSSVAPDSTTTLSWSLYGTSAVLGTTQLFQPPHDGLYVCTATNANGCAITSVPFAFTNLIIPPVLNTSGMTEGCQGQNINLVVLNAASYSSLIWSNGANTSNIVVNNSGLFSVTGYNNGCQQTSVIDTVVIHPNPTATISGNSQFCEGSTDTLSVSAGASTYYWNTNQNTASISVTNSGTYSVTTTNTFGCTSSASITVTANPLPIPVIAVNGCVAYITNSQPGDTQEWYINGVLTSSIGDNISASTIGMYQVFVTNSSGCRNGSNSIYVNCTAGIEEAVLKNASIYQTDDELVITLNDNKDHAINIFDTLGKKVFEKTGHGKLVIQTNNFNSGMYFIQGLGRFIKK